jgi:hypothetical protein
VLGVAFRRLLQDDEPLGLQELAASAVLAPEDVEAELELLASAGRVRRDRRGHVVGILGLSLEPTRHEIRIDELRRWTWCAYDAVGILGALGRDGVIRSTSPLDGSALEIPFVAGTPVKCDLVLFMPEYSVDSVVDEWCPLVNFFSDADAAARWSGRRGVQGRILAITDATRAGAEHWGRYVRTAG